MKKHFLRLYDKVIIATLLGITGLMGCNRKNYPEKQIDPSEQTAKEKSDSLRICDTILMPKTPNDRVIALYGVRPTELDK